MFCAKCGATLDDGAKFCAQCGAKAPKSAGAPSPEKNKPAPAARAPRDNDQPRAPRRTRGPAPVESGPQKNMGMWIAVVVVVVVGVVWAVRNSSNDEGAGQQTLVGGGAAPAAGSGGGGAAAPTQNMPAPTGPSITGTVEFSSKVPTPQGGIVYLIARPASAPGAAPLAVSRVTVPGGQAAPIPFQLTSHDVMGMSSGLDQPVMLEARWDEDGDPMSKSDGDIVGKATTNPVQPGATGVKIILDTLGKDVKPVPAPADEAASQPAGGAAPAEEGSAPAGGAAPTGDQAGAAAPGAAPAPTAPAPAPAAPAGPYKKLE